ncbi:MAG: beta-lactamase family protein [Deltaproteobacteria bacterium]|nr:beta-lactamase family protein [Deltaproteobacteria bacterium]
MILSLCVLLLSAPEPLRDPGLTGFLPAAESTQDFDEDELRAFLRDAGAAKTSAVVILRGGKVAAERYWAHDKDKAIHVASIAKVLSGLAIALLVADKKIASVDEPLSRWIPEWKKGPHAAITLRHALSHMTGLEPRMGDAELQEVPDSVRFVASMRLADAPGSTYIYSNQAFELLSEVVQKESGMTLARFVTERILSPLGIEAPSWTADRSGRTHGHAGLSLRARDVAKIGAMLCDNGAFGGKQVVPAQWIADAVKPAAPFQQVYGMGVELFPEMGYKRGAIVYDGVVEARLVAGGLEVGKKLAPLKGRRFEDVDALVLQMAALMDDAERGQLADLVARRVLDGVRPSFETSDVEAFGHSGSRGQLMMCVREPGTAPTVVVRLVAQSGGAPFNASERARLFMHPARRCPPFYDETVGDGLCLARGTKKDKIILFLHGLYNPHGGPWVFADEKRFVDAARARGYFVYAPRGVLGAVASAPAWLGFPSTNAQTMDVAKLSAELGPVMMNLSLALESRAKKPYLFGYSVGGYLSAALLSKTRLEFSAWALAHAGGAAFDFAKADAIPTVIITSKGDGGERPNTYWLSAKLERAGWKHRLVDGPGVHQLSQADIDAALDLFDAVPAASYTR